MSGTVNLIRAAELMCVHPKTVQDLIHSGEMPAARIGRAFVLMERDVIDYIERAIMTQTAERIGGPATRVRRPSRCRAN